LPEPGCIPQRVRPEQGARKNHSNTVNRDLDILFVIDNSSSMQAERTSLTHNFQRFINTLEHIDGGLPSVHIGVVSTDLGAGPCNLEQLREAQDQLIRAGRRLAAVGNLVAGLSHELNNPLGVIRGHAEIMLRMVPEGDRLRRPAEAMERQAARAARLVRALHDFGHCILALRSSSSPAT
jgi:signal transduction histidine kinase